MRSLRAVKRRVLIVGNSREESRRVCGVGECGRVRPIVRVQSAGEYAGSKGAAPRVRRHGITARRVVAARMGGACVDTARARRVLGWSSRERERVLPAEGKDGIVEP